MEIDQLSLLFTNIIDSLNTRQISTFEYWLKNYYC